MKWINEIWLTEDYKKSKIHSFELIDSFLTSPPRNILDIGCGLAYESEMFQEKYNSNLFLLDGDFSTTPNASRDKKYGKVDTMAFYSRIKDLEENYKKRNMRYNFIDANNIKIKKGIVFDLVYSNVSCGYHYPLSTYYDLLKKHTNSNSILIFDLHSKYLQEQISGLFEIVKMHPYSSQNKIKKTQLRILEV